MNGSKLASDIKFYSDYAKFIEEEGRVEQWEDSVDRVMSMHRTKYATQIAENQELARAVDFAETFYKKQYMLGSQRALQWGGAPMLKHEAKMYNCISGYADRMEFFQEAMYFLLCGCGVGFSVQQHHIAKLPKLAPRQGEPKVFVIPDSIEGWSDAIGILVASYIPINEGTTDFPEYQGRRVAFDYSLIRKKGSKITGGFKAPGPDGLRASMGKIEELLDTFVLGKESVAFTDIIVYDIVMHMSDAVLSGGVRRSATICLFSPWSYPMLRAKTGNWMQDNPQRARSNNSAVLVRSSTTMEEFSELFHSVKEFGEPGFVWVEDRDITVNPCVTSDTTVMTSEGVKQVKDLINKPFKAIVNGKPYDAYGFWCTGTKSVYKLQTKEGFNLELTDNHKVLTVGGWKEAKDLIKGEKIKLHNHKGYKDSGNQDCFEKGWLLGSLLGDGTFDKDSAILRYWDDEIYLGDIIARTYLTNHFLKYKPFNAKPCSNILSLYSSGLKEFADTFGIKKNDKTPSIELEKTSSQFLKGYIRGLFDADGSVQGSQQKGCSIRLSQSNLLVLEQVQRILLRFGIYSTIYKNRREEGYRDLPDGQGGYKKYFCKANHELCISKINLVKFSEYIGFFSPSKQEKLNNIISAYKRKLNKEKFEASFESLEYVGEKEVYDVTVESVHCFDANGLVAHNCVEIGMWPQTEDGYSGWQGCNLAEINGGYCDTPVKFYEACRAASIIGTLQAGYTNFKYISDVSKKIFEREALLGVSVTGWCNNPEILFNADIQEEGAEIVKITNKIIAKMLGIRPAARTTCVKPSGNASVRLMTASGIHGEHAGRYFRNMQMNKSNDVAQAFAKYNPVAVEESVWNPQGTDWVFSIPIEAPKDSLFKRHLVGVNQLELVRLTQNHWVEKGTNVELCVNPIVRHNVSNTIQVADWDEVETYIYKHREDFAGISLMGIVGDKEFPQAPFTEVLDKETLLNWYGDAALFASGLIVDGMHVFNDDLWRACDKALKGFTDEELKLHRNFDREDWVRRCIKFANNYFEGDVGKTTHCLKDLYNYHKWVKITNNLVDIDWKNENIVPDYVDVDTLASAACIGGVCEI